MVSLSVSPLLWLVLVASAKPMTLAPRRLIAVSKLSRVLVEGSKKRLAITFPSKNFCSLFCSNSFAVSRTCRISSLVKSLIEIKLLLIFRMSYYKLLSLCNISFFKVVQAYEQSSLRYPPPREEDLLSLRSNFRMSYYKLLSLYFFQVAAFDVGHALFEGVDQGKPDIGVDAAFHIELLVLLLQPHVLKHLHHRVHAHISEVYPV